MNSKHRTDESASNKYAAEVPRQNAPASRLEHLGNRTLSAEELKFVGGGADPHVHGKTNW